MAATVKTYHQIHIGERRIIERLYAKGYNASRIAREIFRSRSTVMREIKRNGFALPDGRWQYSAEQAQNTYFIRTRLANRSKWNEHPQTQTAIKPAYYLRRKSLLGGRKYSGYHKTLFRRWRWKKNYVEPLISWQESWKGKEWRSWYNSRRRQRCYSWEEMGRVSKRFRRRFAFCFYKRLDLPRLQLMATFLTRRKNRKDLRHRHRPVLLRYRKRWWETEPVRLSRKSNDPYSPLFQLTFETPSKQQTVQPPTVRSVVHPLVPTVFSKLNGKAMSNAPLNRSFSKIPSLFQQGSPRFFLKPARSFLIFSKYSQQKRQATEACLFCCTCFA